MHSVDARFFLLVSAYLGGGGSRTTARLISRLADGPLYLVIALGFAACDGERGLRFLTFGLACYALEVPLYLLLKRFFKRERPFRQLNCWHGFVPADEFSFPSGHTAAAAVFAALLGIYYVDNAFLLCAGVFLVGASRVVLGVHFPGDIFAGAILGISCVGVMAFGLLP
ncbi:hypothetical protein M5M_14350 [Simiduia agarivorans SA1 = DSM 21679]|uniref:undecaprenyl-diphosphate phosphatase n=1 Tax=Simiduia agarivorans (strain DSM 21679 / JCM 13881 / BCRC 17597 / SA1) TaxID=1117647 RepID=K4KLU1_SIMAS|nr:hypothetical protein M5M_14350 [Simiduia agarivorans SA1 = DSM 21679]